MRGLLQKAGQENFSACAWLLERRFPQDFSRPETQLNLAIQNNVTENHLTINVTGEQARQIESQADPVRQSVAAIFERYRPAFGNGNGGGKAHEVKATSVPTPGPEQPMAAIAVITRRVGDEKRQAFWKMLVSSDPEKALVTRETAIFVCRTVLAEALGYSCDWSEDRV